MYKGEGAIVESLVTRGAEDADGVQRGSYGVSKPFDVKTQPFAPGYHLAV